MALPTVHYPYFERPRSNVRPRQTHPGVDTGWATPVATPTTLPISEKHFRWTLKALSTPTPAFSIGWVSGHLRAFAHAHEFRWPRYVRLAVCSAFLLGTLHLNASDGRSSCPASTDDESAGSAHSTVQLDPGPEAKAANPDKYDVKRIGQRNTGKGVNLYSLEKERALGQSMADTIDRQTNFVTDPDIVKYVSGVAQRIVGNSDAQVAFTIKVVDSDDLSVFALPGGFLYVDKGLLSELDSEAELAGLIAHEVAHVAARHATRYATRRTAWNALSFPVIYMAGPGAIGARQIGPLALRKFARDAELEADLLGMEYQYSAGYDPRALIDALEKLNNKEIRRAKQDRANGGFFGHSVHRIAKSYAFYPPIAERILRLQSELSTMLPCRPAYLTDTSEFQDLKAQLLAGQLVLHRNRAASTEDDANGGPVLRRHPSEWQGPLALQSAFTTNSNPYIF